MPGGSLGEHSGNALRSKDAPSEGNTNHRSASAAATSMRIPEDFDDVFVVFSFAFAEFSSPSYDRRALSGSSSSLVPLVSISRSPLISSACIAGTRSWPRCLSAPAVWPHCSRIAKPSASCVFSRASRAASRAASRGFRPFSTKAPAPLSDKSAGSSPHARMCASHLRSGNDRARDLCLHSPVFASRRYSVRRRQPWSATACTAASAYAVSAALAKYGRLNRVNPGRITSDWSRSSVSSAAAPVGSKPSRLSAYGPAHAHPPRTCTPNTSLSTAHTKLWCRNRLFPTSSAGARIRNETIGNRSVPTLSSYPKPKPSTAMFAFFVKEPYTVSRSLFSASATID
mmetsp:Transcript_3445/g.14506  ORF Transcript_3445/g.14506 Transcript_3445/m.14506 type:complete len:342 (+) Transcript_3445:2600-3625(+)